MSWAKIVSDVFSPPVVWAVMSIPIASRDAPSSDKAVLWAFIYIVMLALVPILYILFQVRRGNITDMHMPERSERIRPFVVSIFSAIAASVLLKAADASALMMWFVLSSLIQLFVMIVITRVWKISIHMIGITGMVITVGVMFGLVPALILLPLVPIVGVARLNLHRHTRSQVIAGIIVGGISVSSLLALASILEPGVWSRY
jgi:hypothetical protein